MSTATSLACVDADVHATLDAPIRDVISYLPRAWREKFDYLGAIPIASAPIDFNYLAGRYVAGHDTLAAMQFPEWPDTEPLLAALGPAEVAQVFAPQGATHVHPSRGVAVGVKLASAFNDYVLDRWITDDRLRYALIVSPDDPHAAAAEVRRLGDDRRVSSVWLPYSGMRFGDQRFQPLYDAAVEHGLPISGHPFAPRVMTSAALKLEGRINGPLAAWSELSSLIARGTLQRNPDLRFAFYETGFTWLEAFLARVPDAELVRERIRVSVTPDGDPTAAIERCGALADVLIHASNTPQGTGQTYDTAGEELRQRLLAVNAAAALRL